MLTLRSFCAVVFLLLSVPCFSWAQSANQGFDLTVPATLSIVAPTANVVLTHNKLNNNQNFPVQSWTIAGNSPAGVAVSFSTATPFVHATQNTFKADAKLTLAVGATSGGPFTITTATDTTNFATNDNVAAVVATSSGPVSGKLNLSVSFVSSDFGVLAAGTYRTTVTGTIAAN
jgi:hypothetical protein